MSASILSSLSTSAIALVAYTAVPILFVVIYPYRLNGWSCGIFGSVHGALMLLFYKLLGFNSVISLILAAAEALVWTGVAILVIIRLTRLKKKREAQSDEKAVPWYRKGVWVKVMLTALIFSEVIVCACTYISGRA